MPEIDNIKKLSKKLRKNILFMAKAGGSHAAHIGGALSIVDVLSTLFSNYFVIKKNSEDRDRFILSKGHACLVLYAILYEKQFINESDLETFEQSGSDLLGHPVKNKKIGIDFSNGSLGMGLSLGIGVAISSKKKKKNFNIYVVMGDGECNEGSVWEAAMAAPNFKLDNLYVIIDKNNFQQTGSNKEIMNVESLKEKWQSFGWQTSEIDGHNIEELYDYFEKSKEVKKPKALIANTIKGKGFSFSENNNDWHHAVLTKSLYETAMNEVIKKKPYGNKR